MAEEVKLWQVENGDCLMEIPKDKLDFERRLEEWLKEDISILSPNLLIIGQQVECIDLLCMDSKGDLIIVELKRDKTPREVTAQVLDYASWVEKLSPEQVLDLAGRYFADKSTDFETEFKQKFRIEIPAVLNDSHAMLIVASDIDESTERIINYLSDSYGVNINVAQFRYFRNNSGQEFVARVFLIEESEVEQRAISKGGSKRLPNLKYEELEEIAEENGVGDLYRKFVTGLEGKFSKGTTRSQINFKGNVFGKHSAIFNLLPHKSSREEGLAFEIYLSRFINYSKLSEESVLNLLPLNRQEWKYYPSADEDFSGFEGYFKDQDVEKFLNGIQNVKRQ